MVIRIIGESFRGRRMGEYERTYRENVLTKVSLKACAPLAGSGRGGQDTGSR